eukprot:TRINITY_DN1504_c0_g1_i1.p1 TRINITY_DN1504_c0_g1~~TRINITY_DN1504_c0_g1_i1.p1  ORF type:complete len:155 (+),score=29.53 TRINITY_DN1504_c0_g1_i1:140-604(+)
MLSTITSIGIGNASISRYAHWGSLVSCAFLLLLGLIACITVPLSQSAAGLASIIVGLIVLLFEGSVYVEFLNKHLEFFLENFLFRAVAYGILSIPELTKGITVAGGVFLLLSALAYGFAWWKGEKGLDQFSRAPDYTNRSTSLFDEEEAQAPSQ